MTSYATIMESHRKRKFSDENPQKLMSLLKRLHLEKTNEMFERAPLYEKKPALCGKRWRLSPIREESTCKRRRLDTEMADQMRELLFISDKQPAKKQDSDNDVEITDLGPDEELMIPENISSVNLNIDLKTTVVPSLEDRFIQERVRQNNLQVMLWTPPLNVDTLISNSVESSHRFTNDDGDTEYMC